MSDPAFVPTSHPVRNAVLAIAVLAAGLAALGWSAVAAPRLTVRTDVVRWDGAAGEGAVTLHVTNEGATAVHLVEASFPTPGAAPLLTRSIRLEPHASIDVVVPFSSTCRADTPLDEPVQLTARTVLGFSRTARHGVGLGTLPCDG